MGARLDVGVALVARIPTLRKVELFGVPVSDEGVAVLLGHPRLATIDLRRTKVRGACLPALAALPRLAELRLPRVPRADRKAFEAERPDVLVL